MYTTLSDSPVDRAGARPPRTRAGRRWLDAPVRRKVLAIVLLVALLCLPPIIAGLVLDAQLDDERADTRRTLDATEALRSLRASLLDADTAFQFYGTDGAFASADYAEDFRVSADAVPAQIEAVQDALPDEFAPAGREVAQRAEAMIDQIEVLFGFGAAGTEPADVEGEPGLFELNPALVDELTVALETSPPAFAAIDELARRLDQMLGQNRAEVDRLQERFVWVMLASLTAALLAAAGGAFVVTSGILRRVDQLTESGEQFLRTGRLASTTRSADEIGRLTDKILVVAEMLDDRRREAVAATRTKDEFLSRVSHELKTPLSAMIGLGNELEGDADLSPESRDDAAHIVNAGDHLRALVDELLDIKAIEMGQLSIATEHVSVDETASDAIALVRSMPAAQSITIAADCPDDAVVAADRRRLREVLLNLLSNAVKYNHADGRVDLTARRRNGLVRIAVRDTGPGISAADQERLFQPFERLAAERTDVEGSGVGLAVTKRVVEAMGGTIGIDSGVGQGSTFWFDLPASDAPRPPDPPAPHPAPHPGVVNVATAADHDSRGPVDGVRFVPPRTRVGQRWLDAPVRHKMGAVILLIGIICLPPVVLGVMVNIRLTDARTATLENAQRLDDLDELHSSVQDAVYAMQYHTVFAFSEPQFVGQYRDAAEPIPAELAAVLEDMPPDLAAPARELDAAVEELLANLDDLAATPEATLDDAPGDRIVFELDLATIDLLLATFDARLVNEEAVERLEAELEAQAIRDRQDVDRWQSLLAWTTAASLIAALVAATGGTYVVTRGIVRRIERLSTNGERFLVGEPLLPTAASADEIGRLTRTILRVALLLDERRMQAVTATRAKDDFLSRVSHELKTPLTAMIGFAQLLEEDPDLSPEGRAKATDIVAAGHHLHALIEELLDIKAIEAGRFTIATEPMAVRATAEDAVALVQRVAAGRSIVIGVDCPADLVVVADPRRLREVLVNLLSNAVKYNREGGRADLTATRHDDDTVRISVTDTGPGISPADQDLLFEPFERLGAADTATEGSGVGLTLTKNIVEAMDGSIDLTSTLGVGSTFWVDLPAAHTPAGDGELTAPRRQGV